MSMLQKKHLYLRKSAHFLVELTVVTASYIDK